MGASRDHPYMSSENMSTEGAVLPEDIWSEIAEQLSAFDVFSLSQVRIVNRLQDLVA